MTPKPKPDKAKPRLHRYVVTGAATVNGVAPGGTVELDPGAVNVDALIRSGCVAVPGTPSDTTQTEGEGD